MLKTPTNPPCKICTGADVVTLYRLHNKHEKNPFTLLECRACGFRFIDYMDAPHLTENESESESESKVEDIRDEVAEGLEHNHDRIRENAELLRARLPPGNAAVLDVGSGGGGFLSAIQGDYGRVSGVELDPRYRRFSRARGLEITDRPLEDQFWDGRAGAYDAVTLWDVIEHVNDPKGLAERINELLKPGGILLIDTPTRDGFLYRIGNLLAKFTGGRRTGTMGIQYSSAPFCHKQIFRRRDMRKMLDEAGFRDVAIVQKFELSFPPEYYTKLFIHWRLLRRLINPMLILAFRLTPVRNKMIVTAVK